MPLLCFGGSCGEDRGETVTVFAAASLRPVVEAAVAELGSSDAPAYVISFAGSSALARQVDAGAPADVFLSANADWIAWLAERTRLVPGAEVVLASNRLVLVAPRAAPFTWSPGTPLGDAFDGPIALAEPSHVPAGLYARQALEKLGAWEALEPRVVGASDVRAALRFVSRGGAAAGIVYDTDARGSDGVAIVARMAPDLHGPIRYVGAPIRGGSADGAKRLLDFLTSARGRQLFADHGFLPPTDGPS